MPAVREAFGRGRLWALRFVVWLFAGPAAALADDVSSNHDRDASPTHARNGAPNHARDGSRDRARGASADRDRNEDAHGRFGDIETHRIFGFTDGADIDPAGHKELEFTTNIDYGRRAASSLGLSQEDAIAGLGQGAFAGAYRAIEQSVEFEQTPTDRFEYSFGAAGLHHRIRGVEGMENFTGTNLKGLSSELRYAFAKRSKRSPFGVTVQTDLDWSQASEDEGRLETGFALSSRLIVDAELIPRRLYGAVNLIYASEIARARGEAAWSRSSTLGVTGGLAYRVTPKVAFGWGLQYYRTHESLGSNRLSGQALFGGPTLYVEFSDKLYLSFAFSAQLRGHAAGETHRLDLTNFSKRMVRLLIGYEF